MFLGGGPVGRAKISPEIKKIGTDDPYSFCIDFIRGS